MVDKLGFQFLTDVQFVNNKLTINKNESYNQIYAIYIDGQLVYIGKTNRWRKRWDTYRNCINWIQCNPQNRLKTQLLTEAVLSGKKVEIYCKECKEQELENHLLIEEQLLIKELKPKWNIQHAKIK